MSQKLFTLSDMVGNLPSVYALVERQSTPTEVINSVVLIHNMET